MAKRIFNLIILDESGSMETIKPQAISGVNETIRTILNAQNEFPEQEHYLSLVSFNSRRIKTVYDRIRITELSEYPTELYRPDACTPLYDAMGTSISRLRNYLGEDDVVLVTIITDGLENSSHEYNVRSIKSLVESLKKCGWVFTYIGANQDVEQVADDLAISNKLAFKADRDGTREMFRVENRSRFSFFSRLAGGKSTKHCADDYFAD